MCRRIFDRAFIPLETFRFFNLQEAVKESCHENALRFKRSHNQRRDSLS
jgi:hypothetical protein